MNTFRIGAAALAVLAFGATPAAAQHPGQQEQAASQTDPTSAESRRADIAVFREQFIGRDAALAVAGRRDEAERRLAALEAQAGNVSQAYFELELARIVALADNGHSAYFPGPRSRRFNRIMQVRFAPFGEDFYVLRANPANADLLGAKLERFQAERNRGGFTWAANSDSCSVVLGLRSEAADELGFRSGVFG